MASGVTERSCLWLFGRIARGKHSSCRLCVLECEVAIEGDCLASRGVGGRGEHSWVLKGGGGGGVEGCCL